MARARGGRHPRVGCSVRLRAADGFHGQRAFLGTGIVEEGVIRSSTGDGRIPFIHSDDIADVVVAAMTNEALEGHTLSITGPEALSYGAMTAKIGAVIGRSLRYEAITDDDARRLQVAWDVDPCVIDAHVSIYRAIREGRMADVTRTAERVLGRRPRDFDTWVTEHVRAFAT